MTKKRTVPARAHSDRLEIPRLRRMHVSVYVLPTDDNVDSMDMALAISKALRELPLVQAVSGGDVTDPRFPFPEGGFASDSMHRCRIPNSKGHGLMSEEDAAGELGVTKRTLQRWAREGSIDSTMHRGERRIPREAVRVHLLAKVERLESQVEALKAARS